MSSGRSDCTMSVSRFLGMFLLKTRMRWIGSELEEPDFVLAISAFAKGSHWQAAGR